MIIEIQALFRNDVQLNWKLAKSTKIRTAWRNGEFEETCILRS